MLRQALALLTVFKLRQKMFEGDKRFSLLLKNCKLRRHTVCKIPDWSNTLFNEVHFDVNVLDPKL